MYLLWIYFWAVSSIVVDYWRLVNAIKYVISTFQMTSHLLLLCAAQVLPALTISGRSWPRQVTVSGGCTKKGSVCSRFPQSHFIFHSCTLRHNDILIRKYYLLLFMVTDNEMSNRIDITKADQNVICTSKSASKRTTLLILFNFS